MRAKNLLWVFQRRGSPAWTGSHRLQISDPRTPPMPALLVCTFSKQQRPGSFQTVRRLRRCFSSNLKTDKTANFSQRVNTKAFAITQRDKHHLTCCLRKKDSADLGNLAQHMFCKGSMCNAPTHPLSLFFLEGCLRIWSDLGRYPP